MARELPAHIWFVRSNGGSGSYPVKPEGWRVVWTFAAGVGVSILLAALLASLTSSTWVWIAVFVVGMAASAWYFIGTARKHTDYSITYDEFKVDRGLAG